MAETMTVKDRLQIVQERIASAAPTPERVTLVAVTKRFNAQIAREALDAGLDHLGENYAQELITKAGELDNLVVDTPTVDWHFIGHLQRNKIKKMAGLVSLWHTVDRVELATEISKRAPGARILVQVNTTGEGQKSGCLPGEAAQLVDHARNCGLDVAGLMTMGPTDRADPAPAFAQLYALAQRLEVAELSMGMSADLEVALAEGATIVRVGSALFGPRSSR